MRKKVCNTLVNLAEDFTYNMGGKDNVEEYNLYAPMWVKITHGILIAVIMSAPAWVENIELLF